MPITKEHRQKITESRKRTIDNRTHCKHGHLWIKENIRTDINGKRSCIICRREFDKLSARKRNKTNEGKTYRRNSDLKKNYGITINEYNILLEKQNYCCGICGRHEEEFSIKLAVDHCHFTDTIRGLLCNNCNLAIGKLQDDVEILKNAIKYLQKSKQ